ncbi:MAG: hypothetical protein WBM02_12580 [bacterium]
MTAEASQSTVNNHKLIWLIAWLIALTSRMLFPLADPPADLSWSGGYYADEGFWVHNARNEILFGSDQPDDWNNKLVSPSLHYSTKLLFKCLGISLMTVRIQAMLMAVVTLFFFSRISRRIDPSGLLFLMFAVNSFLVAYQRTAVLESAALPIAVLAMWLWLKGQESKSDAQRYIYDFLTGIAAAWVWQIKLTQLTFIPLVMLATWLSDPNRKRAVMTILRQTAGAGAVALVWLLFIRIPNSEMLGQYNRFYLSQHGSTPADLIKNLLMQPLGIYVNRLPVMFPTALLMTGLLMVRRRFRLLTPAIVFSWIWFVLGCVSLAPLGYRPLRYYLPVLIPMTVLSHRFLTNRDISSSLQKLKPFSRIFVLLLTVLPPAVNIAILLDKYVFNGTKIGLTAVEGFSVIGAVSLLIWTAVWGFIVFFPARMTRRLALQALVFCLAFQAIIVGFRLINRTYDLLNTSRDLARILPEKSVLAGQWAPELVLETPFRAIPLWKNFVNWEDPFTRYGVTHLLCWRYPLGNECSHQEEWFPEICRQAELIGTYSIKKSDVLIKRVVKPVSIDSESERNEQ